MQTVERSYTIKKIISGIESNNIVFDHPMQRRTGQWNEEQKSLLIHSILGEYAIPQIYVMQMFDGDFDSYSVLDGKQRLSCVDEYIKGDFKLGKTTPMVKRQKRRVIIDEIGNKKSVNTIEEYDVAGKLYSELPVELQEKISDHKFAMVMMIGCTDEEIEDQFFRLNNGTPLTKDQKARVKLGDELAEFIDRVEATELFQTKAYFTTNQRNHGEVQTCILQTLMLLMNYPFKSFNADAVMEFAEWFRLNHKRSDLDECEELFEKLNQIIPQSETPNKQMKKINIPVLVYHIQNIEKYEITLLEYGRWIQSFFEEYTPDCEYASYCGQSSTSSKKVKARKIIRMKVADLKSHPKNEEIYGKDEDVSDLVELIAKTKQVHTMVAKSDGTLLAGHRRRVACLKLEIAEVDVEIKEFDSEEEETDFIINNNAVREKTNEQRAREGIALEGIYKQLATMRRLGNLKGNVDIRSDKFVTSEEDDKVTGKTRDIIANRVGFHNGIEANRAMNVVKKADELLQNDNKNDAELILGVLNNRNVSAANSLSKVIDEVNIPMEDRELIKLGKKSPNAYISSSKGKDKPNNVKVKNSESKLNHIKMLVSNFYSDFAEAEKWLLEKTFLQGTDDDVTDAKQTIIQNFWGKMCELKEILDRTEEDSNDSDIIIVKKSL